MTDAIPAPSFPYRCFVINLDRQPERLAEFRAWNDACGLPIERFPAIDGNMLDDATWKALTLAPEVHTKGAFGGALSHRALWQVAAETFQTVMVFEDDAVLRLDIAEATQSILQSISGFWDIILLGVNTNALLVLRPGETPPQGSAYSPYPPRDELIAFREERLPTRAYRLSYAFGIPGYLVSPLGARKLLELCFPIRDRSIFVPGLRMPVGPSTIDALMNAFYSTLTSYVVWPPLVLPPNDPASSGTLKVKIKPKPFRQRRAGKR